jgi:hypothetical protein
MKKRFRVYGAGAALFVVLCVTQCQKRASQSSPSEAMCGLACEKQIACGSGQTLCDIPACQTSFSLWRVEAIDAFFNCFLDKYDEKESEVVINNLVTYCSRDTLAMVKLHEKLV